MATLIASLALMALVGWALHTMRAQRRRGSNCLGCGAADSCARAEDR